MCAATMIKADADGAVVVFGGGKNGLFQRLAAVQRGFQQIEKKQRAVAPAHRQRKQKMHQHRKGAARQQNENMQHNTRAQARSEIGKNHVHASGR